MIDRGDARAVRVGSRRVRVRRSDLDACLAVGSRPGGHRPETAEVDEGSVTAWATFGVAMAEATPTLERADQSELIGALERLTEATRARADSLRVDPL